MPSITEILDMTDSEFKEYMKSLTTAELRRLAERLRQ